MTWDYIFMLALGAYAFKSGGLIILNKFNLDRFFQNSVLLIPIALLAALITEQTFVIDLQNEVSLDFGLIRIDGYSLSLHCLLHPNQLSLNMDSCMELS